MLFPATSTAYSLVTEYCTIGRALDYQRAYETIKRGFTPEFDARAAEKTVYSCCALMSLEILEIHKNGADYLKTKLIDQLYMMSIDSRITHFRTTAIIKVNDYNKTIDTPKVIKGDSYDDFLKDGFVITDRLLSDVSYSLKNYFSEELEVLDMVSRSYKNELPFNSSKIKLKLNIDQLAYLIRLMQESGMFDMSRKSDIAKQIVEHFSTIGTDEISERNLTRKLSETNKSEAIFWEKLLKKWRDKALKV